jgi:hypothetical protein
MDHDSDSPLPNRDVSDTCVAKMDRNEVIEGDAVDTVQPTDISTDNEVLTKMPKTFQILSDSLRRTRKTQTENTG